MYVNIPYIENPWRLVVYNYPMGCLVGLYIPAGVGYLPSVVICAYFFIVLFFWPFLQRSVLWNEALSQKTFDLWKDKHIIVGFHFCFVLAIAHGHALRKVKAYFATLEIDVPWQDVCGFCFWAFTGYMLVNRFKVVICRIVSTILIYLGAV